MSSLHALWTRTIIAGCAALLTLLVSGRASADAIWIVTPIEVGARSGESAVARQVEQALRARGLEVLDGPSAGSEFERKHSRPPTGLPSSRIAELDASLRKLADDLASENLEQAQKALAQVEGLTPYVRDELNHEVQRARRRFHICLLAAHLFAKEGYESDAFEQVRKCARDFPGLEPEQGPYLPESIRNFFAHVHRELETIRPSTVHVDVENSSDLGCRARVNGIDRGPIPATVEEVRTERVRVQVDCGARPGRIYDVLLEPGDNTVRIDPQLDRAVISRGRLELSYPDATAAANNRLLHNLRIARAVGASHVVQIWNGELHRIDVAARRESGIRPLRKPVAQAVADLLDAPSAAAAPPAPTHVPTRGVAPRRRDPYAALAWVSAGAAGLAGAGAFIAWRVREDAVSNWNDASCLSAFARELAGDCPSHLSRADSAETAIRVFGFTAIGLAALAATFFVLDLQHDRPHAAALGCGSGPGELGLGCTLKF